MMSLQTNQALAYQRNVQGLLFNTIHIHKHIFKDTQLKDTKMSSSEVRRFHYTVLGIFNQGYRCSI